MPRAAHLFLAILSVSTLLAFDPAEARDRTHCPPGLAKKDVPCVPPGQARKLPSHEHVQHDDWRRGERVRGDYVLIPRAEWERLALRDYRDGSTYLQMDNQILRVARDTLIVLEAVRIVDRLLN